MKHFRLDTVGLCCWFVLMSIAGDKPCVGQNETLWLEAEHFIGVTGYCWPMGDDAREMRTTHGHWGLSGPGWAAEWNQGGESGFLSVAAGPAEENATLVQTVQIPRDGNYRLWVRYGDWREQTELFDVVVEQSGQEPRRATFGAEPRVEEDNEMKLYWNWAFAWDHSDMKLIAGQAKINLIANRAQTQARQIDAVVLTTDENYHPLTKERPPTSSRKILEQIKTERLADWRPLARRNLWGEIGAGSELQIDFSAWQPLPDWQPKTFQDRGFRYLWNVRSRESIPQWLTDSPTRVLFPYSLIDEDAEKEFEQLYGGKEDVPIYSDPRIVPTFHSVGGGVFATDPTTGEVNPQGLAFSKWLDEHPDRPWATMMNYHPGAVVGRAGIEMFQKYRGRYIGSVAGESLGYFYPEAEALKQAAAQAQTRRQLVNAFEPLSIRANNEKYQKIYERDLDENPFADVISCHSVGSMAFAPICYRWGARTVGYESAAATSSVIGMRMACQRGAARQYGGMYATYRSCNFGDSSTIFSKASSFTSPDNIFDNYYSVFSGAGMTWYKFDIWYQYMAGSSMFYHEQGFDEFWKPGGLTAAGKHAVQLSPKGKLVDRFLRVTREHPDRGAPVTPVAFLMDYAHGWEPASFWPNSFVNWHQQPDRFLHSLHEQMLQQWLWAAYYPIVAESEKPITGVNEVFVPGVFGDLFDCVFANPESKHWAAIDRYPVLVAIGDLEVTESEVASLTRYVEQGGTLLISADQLPASAYEQLNIPIRSEQRRGADRYVWNVQASSGKVEICERFEFAPIDLNASENSATWTPLATSPDGDCFCAYCDNGLGRMIVMSVPRGLTVSGELHPACVRLLGHLTREQMPIEVEGDVEWLLNRAGDSWLLTLLNPAGQAKPQQGITPTDYRQNRSITIKSRFPIHSAADWLAPDDIFSIDPITPTEIQLTVPAGGIRVVEIK